MLFDEKNELKSAIDDMSETMANMSKNMKDIQLKCNEMEERLKVKKALKDKEDKGLKIVMWIIFLAFLGISCLNYYDEVMIQKKLTKGFILHISSLIIGFVIALHFKHIAGWITNYYYIYAGILEIFSKM